MPMKKKKKEEGPRKYTKEKMKEAMKVIIFAVFENLG